ncbi:MAG: VanZ family protein [Pyrinomonadaceae bacterium]|nr:VanZ family protein [Pyrinomonadaceae bacterium]
MSNNRPKRETMSIEEATVSPPIGLYKLFQRRNIVARSGEITSRELTLSWRNVWLCCVLFIVAVVTYPWTSFLGYARWDKVLWVPFQDVRNSLDALENIVLYVPFGFSSVQSRLHVRSGRVVKVALLAALLSVSCEFYQVFCNNRVPSMTDVTSNTLGGVIGALIAGKLPATRVIIDK